MAASAWQKAGWMNGISKLVRAAGLVGSKAGCGLLVVGLALLCGLRVEAQAGTAAPAPSAATPQPAKPQQATQQQQQPLQMHSLDSTTQADPFPRPNPENFTADTPTVATVDSYLKAVLGWDANRIWRVEAIEKTVVPGMSKVVVMISQRGAPATKTQTAIVYTMPDGKHLVADANGPQPFGAHPYAETRALLQARADGPAMGATAKDFEFVEFSDLQCVRCKEAEATMKRLAADFPTARIVFENRPEKEIHPSAYEAAAWGACIALDNAKSFYTYAQAVYDTQADLTPDKVDATLAAAVTKAGLSPEKVSACSKTALAKDSIAASLALAHDVGVEQSPALLVNGRQLPLVGVPYETLKQIIVYQARLDGVSGVAPAPLLPTPAGAGQP